jgi:hypothetical protein
MASNDPADRDFASLKADLFSYRHHLRIAVDHCLGEPPELATPYPRVHLGPLTWYPSVEQLEDLNQKLTRYLDEHKEPTNGR